MASPAATRGQTGAGERMVSASSATRLVLLLLALWSILFGLTLTFAQGASPLGGSGGDEAARRLLGVHVLALAPVYGLLGWNPRKYGSLLWLPYVTQFGIVVATLFDLVDNNLDFGDAGLPLVVSIIFFILLGYLWWAARRPPLQRPAPLPRSEPAPPPPSTGSPPMGR